MREKHEKEQEEMKEKYKKELLSLEVNNKYFWTFVPVEA